MMKKQMMILTAAMIGILFTGCGSDPVQINVNIPADTETTAADTAETTAAETASVTTAAETEVTAADTIAAVSIAAQTASAQTAAAPATTAAPAAECRYSADDLVGEWSMPGTFGTRNNSMTVRKDGSVIMRYAAGGSRFGKIRIDAEEHPDGSKSWWYAVVDDDSTPWISFACGDKPVDRISSGQDGAMQFVRVSLEDVAVEKMNNLTFLMKSMAGGGDLATDPGRTMTADNRTYTLVTDERFAINSLGKAAFERLLEETVSGTEYTHWKAVLDDSFRVSEPDGQTYVLTSNAHGFYTFETGHGVTITNQTDSSFTAETKDSNQLDGRGTANFVFDGLNWTIESYTFQ